MVSVKSILVVDDDPGLRRHLSEALSRAGHRVTTARDGLEAVQRLLERHYDAVVTDVNMPGMDGIGLLQWMRRDHRREKIVVISGSVQQDLLKGKGLPPIHVRLRKPFAVAAFMEAMDTLFAGCNGNPGPHACRKRKEVA